MYKSFNNNRSFFCKFVSIYFDNIIRFIILKRNKTIPIIFAIVGCLLLIPFIAMQFSNEVNWSFFDFVVAVILLLSTALVVEFCFRKITNTKHRIIIAIIIFVLLFLIWAELAVGIFGTPFAGN